MATVGDNIIGIWSNDAANPKLLTKQGPFLYEFEARGSHGDWYRSKYDNSRQNSRSQ